ncbi:MAG: chromosome segregation protein SMC [Ruminiclostridium sp.]|nr:chromosome segregation protein SMC [Ruminiclostridium sp.]
MHFKTLEIQGFKSFADKTVLDFDTKMTAVVGSNGNGKSNISDALRWVMGEQGAKTLRGDKMEDVIFHGTVTRKQMGFAKVALTIDNTDRALNVDNDEVVIARKLYRTGESEYLINGEKCRLKDIQELLMGTGLGREGYSIIGQGRVAEIVNAKGSQRREIFEEAAGVSKFLHQKADAERELSRAEANYLRLKDTETALAERVPVLQRQSEKAIKAKGLIEREKNIEISVTTAELEKIERDMTEIDNSVLENQGQCEHFDREINELEQQSESLSIKKSQYAAQLDDLRRSSESVRDEIAEADKQIAVLENEIKHNAERIADIEKRREESKRSAGEFSAQIAGLEKNAEAKRREAEKLSEDIEKLKTSLDSADETDKELDGEYKALDSETGVLYAKLTEARLTLQQAEKTKADIEERLETDSQSIDDREKAAEEHRARRRHLNEELEALGEEKAELENKLSGYRKLYDNKNAKLTESRTAYEQMRYSFDSKRQKLEALSDVEKNMVGYFESVKAVMSAKRAGRIGGVHGTVSEVMSVEPRYALAIETALGNAMQNIIVDTDEAAKRCISFLEETKAGRATFYPIATIRGSLLTQSGLDGEDGYEGIASEIVKCDDKYREIIRSLLGRTVIVDDKNTAGRIARKFGHKFRIVSLEGTVVNAGGSWTGGANRNKGSGIISRKQEIDSLEKDIAGLSEKIKTQQAEYSALSAEVSKMEIEIEGFGDRLNVIEREEARLNAEINGLKDLIRQSEEQQDNAEVLIAKSRKQIKEQEELIVSSRGTVDKLSKQIAQNEEKMKAAGEKLEKANTARAEISDKISETNIARLNAENEVKTILAQKTEVERARDAAAGSGERFDRETEEVNASTRELQAEIETKKKDIEEANKRYGETGNAINELIRKENDCEKRISELAKEVREKSSDKEKFSNALAAATEKKTAVERENDKLRISLWDKYNMTVSEAKALAEKIDDLDAARRGLQDLRRQISALGSINFAAIEEYEEIKSQYDALSVQLRDVEKSRDELEKLINNLTADIKARFLSSFNEINKQFSSIFREIFGGGEAHLELIDPENVLESGIEIYAAPPGKLIKNLISLSGGEQTMVAITIYLAILQHRPTPFCMLDEVDAALDEINVVKYVTYLKRFCTKTQLMIITHRRGTIEGCDVLYGVFMQEKGVSRLIHQELIDDMELDLD